jgi:hypothetical protein
MFARRLQTWFFALFLLWGQAAAFAHALEHVGEAATHAPCELCVGQAQLGGNAPPSHAAHYLPLASPTVALPAPPAAATFTPSTRPCARGPPPAPFV